MSARKSPLVAALAIAACEGAGAPPGAPPGELATPEGVPAGRGGVFAIEDPPRFEPPPVPALERPSGAERPAVARPTPYRPIAVEPPSEGEGSLFVPDPLPPEPPELRFADLTLRANLVGDLAGTYPRTLGTGGGVAAVDLDGDGDLDLIVTGDDADTRFYRNDGDFRFADVTGAWSLSGYDHALAVAVGDCDGDRDLDVFLSRWGGSRLLRADGPGVFTDISFESGAGAGEHLGSASRFLDLDGDGDLDLLQLRYRTWLDVGLVPELPRVLLNDGGCRFDEVPDALGLGPVVGLGLGSLDYDGDGDLDLALASDFGMHYVPSTLFENVGGRYEDAGPRLGIQPRIYGMGVGTGDFDNDGRVDLTISNFFKDPLYRNLPAGFHEQATLRGTDNAWYVDLSMPPGVFRYFDPNSADARERELAAFVEEWTGGRPAEPRSFMKVNWSLEPGDFDADGLLDLFVTSGKIGATGNFPEGTFQPDALFHNRGPGGFVGMGAVAGVAGGGRGRGAVAADLDGDGDLDLAVFNTYRREQGQPHHSLFRNESRQGHWLKLDLVGAPPNTHGVGARIEVRTGGVTQVRERHLGTSNFGANADLVHVGLGPVTAVDELIVRWPDGTVDRVEDVVVDRTLTLVQGSAP